MKISPFPVEDVHCFFYSLPLCGGFFLAGAKASSI